MGAFPHTLESQNPSKEDGDRMRWRLKSKGDFDIQSFYGAPRGYSSTIFLWKSIWGMKAPRQVSFLFGQLRVGRYSHVII